MNIIEEGILSSTDQIARLNCIDWRRTNGLWNNNPAHPIQILNTWLVGHAKYTLIEEDLTMYPIRSDFPNWTHQGNGSHEHIARLYWNMFHERFTSLGDTLILQDSPDFQGTIANSNNGKTYQFWGDIGQVSVSAFVADVLPNFNAGNLWITLYDEKTQLVIEGLANIGQAIQEHIIKVLGFKRLPAHTQTTTKPKITQPSLFAGR